MTDHASELTERNALDEAEAFPATDHRAEAPATATPVMAGLARAAVWLAAGKVASALRILRALPTLAATRAEAVTASIRAASHDPEFRELVLAADAARDGRDFARGEFLYWRCLGLYPLHHGYMTQYGHCLKEQGRLVDAELVYRSALALGGQAEDLHRHITAVAGLRGAAPNLPAPQPQGVDPIDEPPTARDVTRLFALLLNGGEPANSVDVLDLLIACPRRRDVVLALLARPAFPLANHRLMALLAEAD
ncbi:hypothetical protein KPL78_12005 [Roseomonas sp. HJA6]|uniref:Tetratricopeptide repeat protein n=1 Tax=Roseomonas alba TaxID=2846776 RepID=A0ABS7A8E7_9PROT|nr:hypothetical protein [Neoroseomonas alba]MBW6398578.1 hypothetical protein [Neoroseomonas alba]